MPLRQTPDLPKLWLLSDVRNDAGLEFALARLPRGSGFVFRHYHLAASARRARFDALSALAREDGHTVVLSGSGSEAARWGADGIYGPPARMSRADGLLGIATAHDAREIVAAKRAGADAVMLSPVFPSASHPGGRTLGTVRFRMLARGTPLPVIALGGMDAGKARRLGWERWAAIDGLS